jgi:hypothetical protein
LDLSHPSSLLVVQRTNILRIAAGAGLVYLAIRLVAVLPLDGARTFGVLATATVLGGLIVDALLGDSVRAGIGLQQ